MTTGFSTTVTYLELIPPPGPRVHVPSGPAVALLKLVEPPLHYYRYLMHRVGKPWTWVYRLRMSDEELASIIHAPTTELSVLMLNGAPAGFFELDFSEAGRADLAYFGMMPHATGQGLGRWFLSEAIHAGCRTGIERMTVNTCTLDHPAALPLYQRMGFRPVSRSDTVIEPLTDAEKLRIMSSDA